MGIASFVRRIREGAELGRELAVLVRMMTRDGYMNSASAVYEINKRNQRYQRGEIFPSVEIACILRDLGKDFNVPTAQLEAWASEYGVMRDGSPDHMLKLWRS
jgi:hypothetical protein